jgi:hypothetical protein
VRRRLVLFSLDQLLTGRRLRHVFLCCRLHYVPLHDRLVNVQSYLRLRGTRLQTTTEGHFRGSVFSRKKSAGADNNMGSLVSGTHLVLVYNFIQRKRHGELIRFHN